MTVRYDRGRRVFQALAIAVLCAVFALPVAAQSGSRAHAMRCCRRPARSTVEADYDCR